MANLTVEDIKVGTTYRAKQPTQLAFTNDFNDRTVLWLGKNLVQYDGPAVHIGRRYPKITMEKFLKWASHMVENNNG